MNKRRYIHTVALIRLRYAQVDDNHTYSWYDNLNEAKESLLEFGGPTLNEDDHYNYAVVERIKSGVAGYSKEWWYRWVKRSEKFTPCKKPKALSDTVCFSIG